MLRWAFCSPRCEPLLAPFDSVTGFQVVALPAEHGGGFVTFEGNGRREALARAFAEAPDVEVRVEVREYLFPDAETAAKIVRRIVRTRRWKAVTD